MNNENETIVMTPEEVVEVLKAVEVPVEMVAPIEIPVATPIEIINNI